MNPIEFFLRPTFVVYAILALAIANLWRKRRESRGRLLWVTGSFLLLSFFSIPAVAFVALGTLEWSYPPSDDLPENPQALVVLSGYMYAPDNGRLDRAELSSDTYYRCRHALALYRKARGCPILVSGGISDGAPNGPPLADAMRDFFLQHGVPDADVIVENRSLTTRENAVESCKLLHERGLQRIVLITDAKHMWRSLLCFRKQGMEAVPSACNSYTARFRHTLGDYLPSPRGTARLLEAFHEWMGVGYYKLRGWI